MAFSYCNELSISSFNSCWSFLIILPKSRLSIAIPPIINYESARDVRFLEVPYNYESYNNLIIS